MYIRKKTRIKDGKRHDYWALVESYRTERGPRQRTVAWFCSSDSSGSILGDLPETVVDAHYHTLWAIQ